MSAIAITQYVCVPTVLCRVVSFQRKRDTDREIETLVGGYNSKFLFDPSLSSFVGERERERERVVVQFIILYVVLVVRRG
mgnify:FL=1